MIAWSSALIALFVILLGGSLGGIGGALAKLNGYMENGTLRLTSSDTHPKEGEPFTDRAPSLKLNAVKSITLGIVAAFIVPVFLEITTIGSGKGVLDIALASKAGNGYFKSLFLLFGFCTLAAFVAQRFLTRMEQAIFDKLDAVDARVGKVEGTAAEALDIVEEQAMARDAAAGAPDHATSLTDEEKDVLSAFTKLRHDKLNRPTTDEISGTTSQTNQSVRSTLTELENKGLVTSSSSRQGGWRLRSDGWKTLSKQSKE